MGEIFITSDTHFGHENVLKFLRDDGSLLRSGFKDIDHMDEILIENWNKTISPQDKVYHLGDVYMCNEVRADRILKRLNGKKRLILGNHDRVKAKPIFSNFQKIEVWRIFKEHNLLLTHIPIHESSFRKVNYNVHGHIHDKNPPTDRHICVCVEQTNYTPVHIEEIING